MTGFKDFECKGGGPDPPPGVRDLPPPGIKKHCTSPALCAEEVKCFIFSAILKKMHKTRLLGFFKPKEFFRCLHWFLSWQGGVIFAGGAPMGQSSRKPCTLPWNNRSNSGGLARTLGCTLPSGRRLSRGGARTHGPATTRRHVWSGTPPVGQHQPLPSWHDHNAVNKTIA